MSEEQLTSFYHARGISMEAPDCEKLIGPDNLASHRETKMSTPALQETGSKPLDSTWVRAQFPSLKLQVNGQPAAFLDGPAGTQVPKQVIDAVQNYFLTANANTCGSFATSRANDATIASARAAMADFFHCDPV